MPPLAAIARLREKARQCRKAALRMPPSAAQSAMQRLAERWEIMAEAERRGLAQPEAANEP